MSDVDLEVSLAVLSVVLCVLAVRGFGKARDRESDPVLQKRLLNMQIWTPLLGMVPAASCLGVGALRGELVTVGVGIVAIVVLAQVRRRVRLTG